MVSCTVFCFLNEYFDPARGGSVKRFFLNNKVVRLHNVIKNTFSTSVTLHGPVDRFEVYRTQTRKNRFKCITNTVQKLKAWLT
jgi:hypothetical protein